MPSSISAEIYGGVVGVSTVNYIDMSKISLPPENIAGCVRLRNVLPERMVSLYTYPTNENLIRVPTDAKLKNTIRCLTVALKTYPIMIEGLLKRNIVELTEADLKEISGLFAFPKNKTRQRLTLDAQRGNLHFNHPGECEMTHSGLFTQLEAVSDNFVYTGKLDINSCYHRLALPEHLRECPGLP